jgi:hypothetical protein
MKTNALWGAGAVLALATGQAHAGPGYVGGAFVSSEAEFEVPLVGVVEVEDDGWGIDGAAAFETSPGVGLQFGALIVEDADAFSLNGHFNLRDTDSLIGVFVDLSGTDDDTRWAFGAEGEIYASDLTIAAAAGFSGEDDADVWGLDGEVRYFLTDNFRIEGELGFTDDDIDSIVAIGAGGEFQFAETPFSIFGGYRHSEADETEASLDTFTIGARFNFGGTLLDRDRNGASLPGLSQFTGALGI